ncbi:hypothetical protein Purlil1_3910 [Purpureocillium lilacinum]|uniref:GCS light chain n=3 Tax=Purpureocillium lilacinum TaxID=33203 RepID=A0ABR0C5N5_PURLI|nr:hypothetical protein Purlil1_3910 [Purpureocillium lilacinum]
MAAGAPRQQTTLPWRDNRIRYLDSCQQHVKGGHAHERGVVILDRHGDDGITSPSRAWDADAWQRERRQEAKESLSGRGKSMRENVVVSTREGNQGTARARDDLELEASVPPQFWGEGGPSEAGAGFSAVLSGSFWYRRWEDERTPLVEPFLRSSPGQPAQQQPAQHLGTRQTDTAARLGSSNDCARRGRRGQPTITSRWPRPRTPPVAAAVPDVAITWVAKLALFPQRSILPATTSLLLLPARRCSWRPVALQIQPIARIVGLVIARRPLPIGISKRPVAPSQGPCPASAAAPVMTKLILSTGNVMSAGPSIIRKSGSTTRSNLELVNSLREHFVAARYDYAAQANHTNGLTNGYENGNGNGFSNGHSNGNGHSTRRSTSPPQTPVDVWTERDGKALYIPRINWQAAGLREESSEYEITVKLFLLPDTPVAKREQYVREALALVSKELGVETIDLLVVSFPGMSFEGNCEWEADKINAQQGNLEEELATWKFFEELHRQGVAKRLGVAEFGSEKLAAFIKRTTVAPVVDQINLRDCCSVPPPLKKLAEEKGVELNVHIDCTDILPRGTLRELLSHGPQGAGVLADAADSGPGLQGEIVPEWVVRYMAFVRDRGVIENKGYFAGAELVQA